jgi:ElaB/YqjD/DUF883 family membrane-anchored ribosome-binding protein
MNSQTSKFEKENFQAVNLGQTGCVSKRPGQEMADTVGKAAEFLGAKFDRALDRAQESLQDLEKMGQEGWQDLKEGALDYTRQQPLNALLLAFASGILLGWVTKRR